ncbi:MAG TPA: type IV pilus twitching motility protein PilT [Pseudolysinimonas sp.]|nr:type IV pilus twitching motility protein PilT [Pseudolysinimonas sp.]
MSANKPVWEIPISADDNLANLAAAAAAGATAMQPPAPPAAPAAPAYELPVEVAVPAYELPVEAAGAPAPRASHQAWPPPGQPPVPPAQASVPVTPAPAAPEVVAVTAVSQPAQAAPMPVSPPAPAQPPAAPVFPTIDSVPQPGSGPAPSPVADAVELGPLSPDYQNADPDVIAALQQVLFTGASDLHITANAAPMLRVDGGLSPVAGASIWNADKVRAALLSLLSPDQLVRFEEHLELDLAYTLSASARFRVNMYQQRGAIGAAFRLIPTTIKTLEQLGVPESVGRFATLPRGLVLVTGPTGSGKSTTLAALIDLVNRTRADHIVTVEDPIEFMHGNKRSLVNQREVGHDTHSFGAALKHVLRQDPDVILVGEMRDLETISVALTAAETGHLVFATLHTQSAASTIDRVIDVYPPHQQDQVRTQLSATLQGVVSQTLVKKAQGNGRVVATEVLVTTPAISNLVREGKSYQITSAMQAGRELGMHTMDQHLAELVDEGKITRDAAFEKAHDPETLTRLIQRSAPVQQAITFNDEAMYASAEKGRR